MKHIFNLSIFMIFLYGTASAQICIGEAGKVRWQCWRGLFADQFSELTALEFFPRNPDITLNLYSLNAPVNYDNNFGARIAGFIKVPVSDSITFNITGDSRTRFYLSTDAQPQNLQLRAFGSTSTSEFEHTKFPEQTSQKLWLQQGQFYYFEIWYVESSGNDHCKLFWKASFLPNTNWNVITAAFIHDVGCLPAACPVRGTPCNDGNSQTTDDMQDGHCNCIGKPVTSNSCVGVRDFIQRFRYDNISGSSLNELYQAPTFPAMPSFSARMSIIGLKSESQINNMGHMVQGYITVPVTGLYKFNITGDDNTIMFLSSNHDPENKQAHMIMVTGWTNTTEHNKYIWQSTSNLMLQSGQFYYFEINHKEGTGSEHFGIFWQTPFTESGVWKRIPSFYLYDYACTLACIPQGIACDDGNPFTNNDQYDNNCTCTGTPCTGPDCDSPLASYVPYEKCNLTDRMSNKAEYNWLSCQISSNPNPDKPNGHWIQYDLGERHELVSMHIWNYNVENQVQNGFQMVDIDYSENGIIWQNLGQYNWPLATGETQYGGFSGPDISGVHARYILITSLDDTTTCRGLGKIVFKAVICPQQGTECDDGNVNTINDRYNHNCECKGKNIYENECIEDILSLGNVILYSDVYSAVQYVSSVSRIDSASYVGFIGGDYVELNPGFETLPDAVFIASIDECEPENANLTMTRDNFETLLKNRIRNNLPKLQIFPIPGTDMADILFNLEESGITKLMLTAKDNRNFELVNHEFLNKGRYRKRIRAVKLEDGLHQIKLISKGVSYIEKFSTVNGRVIISDQK